jgi:hypothetical protein
MESYKHSCPFCGQHIEYTAGYCGTQMACPICAKTVTFPAVPPGGKGPSLRIKRAEATRAANWSFNLDAILAALREFEHWNMVLVGLVPFIIVVALLVGAIVVKKKIGAEPAMPVAPPIQADPNAWQTMTNLARADQLVQDQLVAVSRAAGAVTLAERDRANVHAYYHEQPLGQSGYIAADKALANAQAVLAAARLSFNKAFQDYQRLGGKVDYSRQLPQ